VHPRRQLALVSAALTLTAAGCSSPPQVQGYLADDAGSVVSFLQIQRNGDQLTGHEYYTDFEGSAGPISDDFLVSGRQDGDAVTLTIGQQSLSGSFTGSTLLLTSNIGPGGLHTLRYHPGTAEDYQALVDHLKAWNLNPTVPEPSG